VVGREHGADHRQHDVERGIGEREGLGVGHLPGDGQRLARAARSPTAISSGAISVPITCAPVAAAGRVALPVPAPTSSTRWRGPTPAACTRAGPMAAMSSAMRE
jgi:hypothetical protein